MKIRITRTTGIDGQKIKPGTIVDAPEPLAENLIERDRAELVDDESEAAEVVTEDGPKFLGTTEDEAEPAKKPSGKRK